MPHSFYFGVFFALAGTWAGCEGVSEDESQGIPPAIVLSDVKLHQYSKDGSVLLAHADEVVYQRDTGHLAGENLLVELPKGPSARRGGVKVLAERAEGQINGQKARAEGRVEAITGTGDRAATTDARFDGRQGTIMGEEPLEATGPGYAWNAKSYVFHVAEQRLELGGGVHARSAATSSRRDP